MVEWVIPSTQVIRRWTTAPQSEQVPASRISVLRSWISMGHHLCIRTSAPIANGRHKFLPALETHQIPPQSSRKRLRLGPIQIPLNLAQLSVQGVHRLFQVKEPVCPNRSSCCGHHVLPLSLTRTMPNYTDENTFNVKRIRRSHDDRLHCRVRRM